MNIDIENAQKYYDGRLIVDVEKLSITHNKIYAVLGMNGSGKSTFINCLAGILDFDKSKINYDGKDTKLAKKDIALMLQNFYIFNDTVFNNIALSLKFLNLKQDKIEERIESYMEYFDIKRYLNKNATKLSGGEKAKVALLRTMVSEKDTIFLDEPTSNMDMESVISAERLIVYSKSIGKTIILVTHNFLEAERIADFIIFMEKGKIIEMGKKEEVFNFPKNELVKKILRKEGDDNA